MRFRKYSENICSDWQHWQQATTESKGGKEKKWIEKELIGSEGGKGKDTESGKKGWEGKEVRINMKGWGEWTKDKGILQNKHNADSGAI